VAKIKETGFTLYHFSMNGIYLIIGGNLENRIRNLEYCRRLIAERIGQLMRVSGIYETAAWGKEDEPAYLNQVLLIHSEKSAEEVLTSSLAIEHELGRTRNKKWEARLIDIDILFYNNAVINLPNLHIPHPRMQDRKFVLFPLCEIAENYVHPLLNKTVSEMLTACKDPLEVKLYFGNE
jgi:2-amino-4-hydroxy-6-hydroxymethyldihydropteridine diphosphokinase